MQRSLPIGLFLEPNNRQSPLEVGFYRMSAVDMLRHQYDLNDGMEPHKHYSFEDHYSMSSLESSNSSMSSPPSPPSNKPKSKKQSYGRLIREIRRLRSENATLHNSVSILKDDLRHEKESRQIAEQVHRKYFEDSIDQHTQLELEIMDQQDELASLRSQLGNITASTTTTSNSCYTTPLMFFGADTPEADDYDDGTTTIGHDTSNTPLSPSIYDKVTNDDDDDDDDDKQTEGSSDNTSDEQDKHAADDQFEDLAVSYLRQALVSNLTSARANLEFDDLMLKYDPSPDRILGTLVDAFLGWLCDTIQSTHPTTTTTTTTAEDDQAVARLITTHIQDVFLHFWKAILERYVHSYDDQYQFLHQTECRLQQDATTCQQYIIQNFHRLLVMFYKYDIVDGDAVTSWWHTLPSNRLLSTDQQDCVTDRLRDVTRKFVEWIDEDDDDDNDGDDDSEGDDAEYGEDGPTNDKHDDDLDDDLDDGASDLVGAIIDGDIGTDHTLLTTTPAYQERKKKSVTIQL